MKRNKPFKYEERQQIEKLLKKNLSFAEIARRIGRSHTGVITEIKRYGGRVAYTANEGQCIADQNKLIKLDKLRKLNVGKTRTFQIEKRIENLEMQVEILTDTIKELLNDKQNKRL